MGKSSFSLKLQEAENKDKDQETQYPPWSLKRQGFNKIKYKNKFKIY